MLVRLRDQGNPTDDVDSVREKPVHLGRVVRHEAHAPDSERAQHVGRAAVVASVLGEAEEAVGLERVEAVLLECIRPELVG